MNFISTSNIRIKIQLHIFVRNILKINTVKINLQLKQKQRITTKKCILFKFIINRTIKIKKITILKNKFDFSKTS